MMNKTKEKEKGFEQVLQRKVNDDCDDDEKTKMVKGEEDDEKVKKGGNSERVEMTSG
jgi:hypothetical protein